MILDFLYWIWSQSPVTISLILLAWVLGTLAAFCVRAADVRKPMTTILDRESRGPAPSGGGHPVAAPDTEELPALGSGDDTVVQLDKYRAS